jgi:hypothetical protein
VVSGGFRRGGRGGRDDRRRWWVASGSGRQLDIRWVRAGKLGSEVISGGSVEDGGGGGAEVGGDGGRRGC